MLILEADNDQHAADRRPKMDRASYTPSALRHPFLGLRVLHSVLFSALLYMYMQCAAGAEEPLELETALIGEVREPVQLTSGRQTHRLVPATTLEQGQTIYYTVRIYNPTPIVARDVIVVRRIPANTVYVEGSAAGPGADVDFSTDGGQTFARAAQLNMATSVGGTRRATPEDYTHIRWRLRYALAPGSVALARFQAVFQ